MNQISACITDIKQVLGELERRSRAGARNILGSWIIWLKAPEIAAEARPGQFVMVRCGDYFLPRPFSIHSVNEKGEIAIFFAVLEDGKGTQWLSERRPGEQVEVFGPLGNGFTIDENASNVLLVAGGMGVAPMYFLAQKALAYGKEAKLLLGASSSFNLLYGLFTDKALPLVEIIKVTEDGSEGYKGLVTETLVLNYIDFAHQIFACGPVAMYRDMADRYGHLLKDKPVQVSLEVRMGCGVGACYGCTVKTGEGLKQVCRHGPVFNLKDIIWDKIAPLV